MPPPGLPEAPPGPRLGQLRAAGPRTAPGGTPPTPPRGSAHPRGPPLPPGSAAPPSKRDVLQADRRADRRTAGRACRGTGGGPGPAPLRAGCCEPGPWLRPLSGRAAAGRGRLRAGSCGGSAAEPRPPAAGANRHGGAAPGSPPLPAPPLRAPARPGPQGPLPCASVPGGAPARARLPLPIKPRRRQSGGHH